MQYTSKFYRLIPVLAILCSMMSYAQQQYYSLSGSVLKASDKTPVMSSVCAMTIASSSNGTTNTIVDKASTDNNGNYTFNLRAGMSYKIVAYPWDANLETQYYKLSDDINKALSINLTQNTTGIDFMLNPKPVYNNAIVGTVTKADGQSVEASLSAIPVNNSNSKGYYASSDKSGTGSFRFENLVPGTYTIYVTPYSSNLISGYYTANAPVTSDASRATLITIGASGTYSPALSVVVGEKSTSDTRMGVKGVIMDENGAPLDGATVYMIDASGKKISGNSTGVTDRTGLYYFEFTGVEGEYVLIAEKAGYESARIALKFDANSAYQAITITLMSNDKTVYDNAVTGVVNNASNAPQLAKVTALLVLADGSISWNGAGKTVASDATTGAFSITNLKPGVYVLYASPADANLAGGYYRAGNSATNDPMLATHIQVDEKGINSQPYLIKLGEAQQRGGFEFYGYVMDETGAPLGDVLVQAYDASGNDVMANQNNRSDKNGYFHIVFPGAGTYTIVCTKDGYQDAVGTLSFSNSFAVQKAVITMEKTGGIKKQNALIIASATDESNVVLSMYPQPASSLLHLRMQSGVLVDAYKVFDVQGRLVSESSLSLSNELRINVSDFNHGRYFIELSLSGGLLQTVSFVK